MLKNQRVKQLGVKNCQIPPPIGTPLNKGGRGDRTQNLSSI
ncbi:hypothetical protein VL20_2810 [Microcystis panniformis FACHB-1757]|uniref:Uncharacterized protein n=1 Tax=Microcystis panniformis FACHB-1757 TaxID=1638788 RepID=A0A0K1S1C6_9CHRO|nr:hypothetical protein VL20_2810 [Microcystis panniformis FACHB-1757]